MGADTETETALVINNAEVAKWAVELAKLLDMSVQDAVATAVRDELQAEREARRRFARMEEIATPIRERAIYPMVLSDHSWLYDENGLPA